MNYTNDAMDQHRWDVTSKTGDELQHELVDLRWWVLPELIKYGAADAACLITRKLKHVVEEIERRQRGAKQ